MNKNFSEKRKFGENTACECEKCVSCGIATDVPVDAPVDERKCYVPGGGQLCRKCCIELYGTDDLRSLQSAELEEMFLR